MARSPSALVAPSPATVAQVPDVVPLPAKELNGGADGGRAKMAAEAERTEAVASQPARRSKRLRRPCTTRKCPAIPHCSCARCHQIHVSAIQRRQDPQRSEAKKFAEIIHGTLDEVWPKVLALNTPNSALASLSPSTNRLQRAKCQKYRTGRALFADADSKEQATKCVAQLTACGRTSA